ncbi:MAG: thrombospondin type 3 repeat-containing protein [Myxococcaceae bacterium]|nr:thrombospondin type 3 repeat-containing protein [Myxococcaceae bacterium]
MKRAFVPSAVVVCLVATSAFAQLGNGSNPECLDPSCGKPKEQGGNTATCVDGVCTGGGCGCSVWVAYTDDGKTLSYTDDADGDGKADVADNCPFSSNRDQMDVDGDGVGNTCDNCAGLSNFSKLDIDGDGLGDSCDADLDGDLVENLVDNCASIPNRLVNGVQANVDGDAFGDVCDLDLDGDGFDNVADLCPLVASAQNVDLPGQTCRRDSDSDGIWDHLDNCPLAANTNNADLDRDGIGDVCDLDVDADGLNDKLPDLTVSGRDNCPAVRNRSQADADFDGDGDACDAKFCLVIDPSNKADCLDPNGPFKVHGGGLVTLKRGEKFRLPLFANRNGAAIEYVWTVVSRPAGSVAAVENPTGAVTMSNHFQYAYTDANVPSFTTDVDGEYDIQLQAKLAFPDRAYPEKRESVSSLKMTATPDGGSPAKGNSCAAVGLDASVAGFALAALALLRRRKV